MAIRSRYPVRNSFILLLLIGLLTLSGCDQGAQADGDSDAEQEAVPIPVQVQPVSRGEIYAVYSGTAAFEVEATAEVVAKVGGEVQEIAVEEGDYVETGQILARLDGDRLRLEVQQAEANLRKLERDYKRNVELHEQGLVSAGAFENIKFELDALRASYEMAQLQLSYTQIRAPFSGVVAERFIKVGNTITENTVTFRVTDLDPLLAYLYVPEREFRRLKAGQAVDIRIDALPEQQFRGRVARISPVVDPGTGTFKVTVEVTDASRQLKPGMFGRLSIVYDKRTEALLVPRVALLDEGAEPYLFAIEGDTAHRRVVETGYSSGADVEVVSGIGDGDQVVVVGQNGLKDGVRVEIVNTD